MTLLLNVKIKKASHPKRDEKARGTTLMAIIKILPLNPSYREAHAIAYSLFGMGLRGDLHFNKRSGLSPPPARYDHFIRSYCPHHSRLIINDSNKYKNQMRRCQAVIVPIARCLPRHPKTVRQVFPIRRSLRAQAALR